MLSRAQGKAGPSHGADPSTDHGEDVWMLGAKAANSEVAWVLRT